MPIHIISASALIDAPAKRVYDVIADYKEGHPQIIPKPPFVSLSVKEGGFGAGTRIHVEMKVFGKVQGFNAVVSEPEPGRVLVETDSEHGVVTTFTVEPRDSNSYVTIRTEMKVPDGLSGKIQKWIFTKVLNPTYKKELQMLTEVAKL
jgi:hypothetical protein